MATKKEEQIAVNGVVRILELEAELAALRELLREWQRVYSTRSNIYYATDAALKGDKP